MMDKIINEDIKKIVRVLERTFFSEKKVLVTGAAGFIGSWLCDVLVDLGAEVKGVDDLSTGRLRNINHLENSSKFKFIKRDVCKFQSQEKFDLILHMAGHASPDEYLAHPIETLQTSSVGSGNMAELARKNDATLLFASTSEVYGDAEVFPTPESYWGKVNPIGPRSCYDEGKRYAEALLVAYHKQYGLNVKLPRIFNTYGPRLREDGLYGRAMSRFILQALTGEAITVYGDGKQTRSFCYITDTVSGLLKLAACKNAKGETVNIGNAKEVTILKLAQKIKEITNSDSPIEFRPLPKDDPKRRCPETTKLEKLVKWKPNVTFEEGLERTINWFESTGLKNRT
ncbi:MAG TPA: UDP-glucuronic acid decarboxylase family protein [Candidatus Acidoferrum sp.]|nr:UDP-glucuronic acid decarboxylase family protein [Candidatus Acidoferrum sp.]